MTPPLTLIITVPNPLPYDARIKRLLELARHMGLTVRKEKT